MPKLSPRPPKRWPRPYGWGCALALALAAALPLPAPAQPSAPGFTGIYTCVDNEGRRLTSDRPIAVCRDREQRILNRDGSLRGVLPPTLTADELAAQEARERRAAELRAAQADAVRRDRNLMARYPDEEQHRKAREAALDTVRLAIKATEQRLRDLAVERKPLLDEAEFYEGRTLPVKLRLQLEANDAAVEAQRSAALNQQAEMDRINSLYDVELERLRRLWAGAAPGSLGPMQGVSQAAVNGVAPAKR
jgi:hypothetical protein